MPDEKLKLSAPNFLNPLHHWGKAFHGIPVQLNPLLHRSTARSRAL